MNSIKPVRPDLGDIPKIGAQVGNPEIEISFIDLKIASAKLSNLANKIESNNLKCNFEFSSGEVADKMLEIATSYNELGKSLAKLVRDVATSVDKTREEFKMTDEKLGNIIKTGTAVICNK